MRIRVLGQQVALSMAVLAVLETTVFYMMMLGVGWLGLGGGLPGLDHHGTPLWVQAFIFSGAMATCLLAFGLYSGRQRARGTGIFLRVVVAALAGVALTGLCVYVIPALGINSRILALSAVSATVVVLPMRLGFSRLMDGTPFRRRVLVYGTGKRASVISRLRRRADQRGFLLAGFVQPEEEGLNIPAERVIRPTGDLLSYCREARIEEIVVAMEDRRCAFPIRELLECRMAGVDVTDLITFLERETGRVRLDVLNPSWLIFGRGFRRGSLRQLTSGLVDFGATVLLLALGLPVMLATAIAIKLEDGWRAPVFYQQERVGLWGRTFQLLKFRSMCVDAEANGQARWAQKGDPRITRVGAVIRKLRIDELPQVFNVLRGEMSFVGPRPERPQFVERLSQKYPYYVHRHCVKPGITGWAQLCYQYGSSDEESLEKLQYDLYYVKNGGLMFDLSILVQTAEVVFFGKGAR